MNTDAPTDHSRTAFLSTALSKVPVTARGHTVAVIGELIGTLSFIFFSFAGTQTANVAANPNQGTGVNTGTPAQSTPSQLLYIALSFGFSLAVNAWVFFRISGGLFNPAVTLGMVMIGAITWVRGILLFIAQMAGAIAGAYIVDALFTGGLNVSTMPSTVTSKAQATVIELLLTTLLVFTIFMLAAEKHTGNFIAPVGIGLALFIAELVGVYWTGGSLNPARSFAPAVVVGFMDTQWIYWVGPICGSILAVIIFKIIKALEYETANPDPEAAAPTGPAPPAGSVDAVDHGYEKKLRGDLENNISGTNLIAGQSNTTNGNRYSGHTGNDRYSGGHTDSSAIPYTTGQQNGHSYELENRRENVSHDAPPYTGSAQPTGAFEGAYEHGSPRAGVSSRDGLPRESRDPSRGMSAAGGRKVR